jgi:hypothetical protein
MTDLAQGHAGRLAASVARPAAIRPHAVAAAPSSGRAAARAALDTALSGVQLSAADQRFLSRLSQWDKRNAAAVAQLLQRAREQGRDEAQLSTRQRDGLAAALLDALAYRTSGAASAGCWDCLNLSSGLCAEHARDADRASAYADLITALTGSRPPTELPHVAAVAPFRRRTPVAS